MTDDFSVDQVLAVKDRKTWDAVERTCRKIIIVTNSHYIWVAVVGIKNRIGISTIAIVRVPYLGMILGME